MYIELNGEYLKENEEILLKTAKEHEGEEGNLTVTDISTNLEDWSFDDGKLMISFYNELGYFSETFKIPEELAKEILKEKIDKAKAFKELLKYADLDE